MKEDTAGVPTRRVNSCFAAARARADGHRRDARASAVAAPGSGLLTARPAGLTETPDRVLLSINLDALSDVLQDAALHGAVFFLVSGNSGWVAEARHRQDARRFLRGVEHVMEYHADAAGACWAAIPSRPWCSSAPAT